MPRSCRLSVVIRTRDIEQRFPELLRRLSRQTLCPSEIVVVDNFTGESQLTKMVALLRGAKKLFNGDDVTFKLAPLADNEFSHPYSTNVGVYTASCGLVCITNGHSLPTSEMWLENASIHFTDSEVAGIAGYSSPHRDGSIWEKLAFRWGWERLNVLSRAYVRDSFFSTVNCIIRRSLWEEYPFDERLFDEIASARVFGGEDHDWAAEMIARGHRIIVEPKFNVLHSHGEKLPQLVSKYIAWRRIRSRVKSFKRPRESYTKLRRVKPLQYEL